MFGKLSLAANTDGTCDLVIRYQRSHGEFGLDFMSREGPSDGCVSVGEYLNRSAKGRTVRSARILLGGVEVLALPITAILQSSEAASRPDCLYLGRQARWTAGDAWTQNELDSVSPGYFDLNPDGSPQFHRPTSAALGELQSIGMRVTPFLCNHGDAQAASNALINPALLAEELATHMEEYELDGVTLDLQNLSPNQQEDYSLLIEVLRQRLPLQKEVATVFHPEEQELDENADYGVLILGNQHNGGEPGPIAPIDAVEDAILSALDCTFPDQLVAAIPFFGRIWGGDFQGQGIPLHQVEEFLRQYNAAVLYDEATQSPLALFTVPPDHLPLPPGDYQVWFENDQSIHSKLALVEQHGLMGATSWVLPGCASGGF